MTIGVISDTHGNKDFLVKALEKMLELGKVDLVIHLGDNYKDAEIIGQKGIPYMRVPGVYCECYKDPAVPNRFVEEFEGWRFLLSHTETSHPLDLPHDLKPESIVKANRVDVFLYGHSHKPRLEVANGILLMNPGHLKQESDKGIKPSFGLIEVERDWIKARLVDLLSGDEICSVALNKEKQATGEGD